MARIPKRRPSRVQIGTPSKGQARPLAKLERRRRAEDWNQRKNGPVVVIQGPTKPPPPVKLDKKRYASPGQRVEVLQRDRYRCRYCGTKLTDTSANIDHVKPYILGGKTDVANLVACCRYCNKAKGNQVIGYAPYRGKPTNPFNKRIKK